MNSAIVAAGDQALASQYNNLRKDLIIMGGEYVVTTGSADAYLASIDAQFVAYAAGDTFKVKTNFANTGTATLNVNSVGAKTLKDQEGNALAANAILSGAVLVCVYNGTDLVVVSGLTGTTGNKGEVELSTSAEAVTGTDTERAVTPAAGKAGRQDCIDTAVSKSFATNYQATESGIVVASSTGATFSDGSVDTIQGFIGSSNPASTFVAGTTSPNVNPIIYHVSISFPVKKDQWYRCVATTSAGYTSFQMLFFPNK